MSDEPQIKVDRVVGRAGTVVELFISDEAARRLSREWVEMQIDRFREQALAAYDQLREAQR